MELVWFVIAVTIVLYSLLRQPSIFAEADHVQAFMQVLLMAPGIIQARSCM